MIYKCKVFDKSGKLKKILRGNDLLSDESKNFLDQKSTKRAVSYIKTMKDPQNDSAYKIMFYNKNCLVCNREFHPRNPQSIYCSHECQRNLYLKNKRKEL